MFEQIFKNIDNALRRDDSCGSELDYVEQSSWILFLKYLDDLEETRQLKAELDGKSHLYESRINKMGNAGRNGGEYYTPRPLIRNIVRMVNPELGKTCLGDLGTLRGLGNLGDAGGLGDQPGILGGLGSLRILRKLRGWGVLEIWCYGKCFCSNFPRLSSFTRLSLPAGFPGRILGELRGLGILRTLRKTGTSRIVPSLPSLARFSSIPPLTGVIR